MRTALFFVFCIFLTSCKKEKEVINFPEFSTNGSNYFAFYGNKEHYIVRGFYTSPGWSVPDFNPGRSGVEFSYLNFSWKTEIRIEAHTPYDENNVVLYFRDLEYKKGLHDLNELFNQGVFRFNIYSNFDDPYELVQLEKNYIEFTRTDSIISGIFEMTVKNKAAGTLQITEGRFDILGQ